MYTQQEMEWEMEINQKKKEKHGSWIKQDIEVLVETGNKK